MESLQSGFQLEQLKLNLFFRDFFDPSSYQHKRRTTFLSCRCLMRLLARWNKNGVYIFSSSRMIRFIHGINT